jgi:GDP-4-dehydro-6-deoxy-D-mannose reductase
LRILVTGATGFVGQHLIQHLHQITPEAEIHGTTQSGAEGIRMGLHTVDLRDAAAVNSLVEKVQPDQIYHLAAQAVVKASFDDPWGTLETNVRSQLNLFLACIAYKLNPRFLVISTGELYANATQPDRPTTETTQPQPTSPYSVSKLTQELLAQQYHLSHQLQTVIVRPFNMIGPSQHEGFVAPDFALQIARIEEGVQPPVMRVGNLEAERDFTDVRDVVRAMRLVMAHGAAGDTYNIASGEKHRIRDILDQLLAASTMQISIEQDPARMRPANVPLLWGDAAKLRAATGWQAEIPFGQSLRDVLDDCRQRVGLIH